MKRTLDNLLASQNTITTDVAWTDVSPKTITQADIGIDPKVFQDAFNDDDNNNNNILPSDNPNDFKDRKSVV